MKLINFFLLSNILEKKMKILWFKIMLFWWIYKVISSSGSYEYSKRKISMIDGTIIVDRQKYQCIIY